MSHGRRTLAIALAAFPAIMLTLAAPLVNRVEPRVLGLPFFLAWLCAWVLLTPIFLWLVYKMEARDRR